MKIRAAKLTDIEEIAGMSMRLEGLEKDWDPYIKDPQTEKSSYIEHFTKRLRKRKGKLFVAEDNGIVGFVSGELQKPAGIYNYSLSGFVHDLYVVKEHRGTGVGRALLDEMCAWFKGNGAEVIEIGAYLDNENAIGFYKKYGFNPTTLNLRKMA